MYIARILVLCLLFIASLAQAKFTGPTQTMFSKQDSLPGTAPNTGAYYMLEWNDNPNEDAWARYNEGSVYELYQLYERNIETGTAAVKISLRNQTMKGQLIQGKMPGVFEYTLKVLACTSYSGCWWYEPVGGRITITVVPGPLEAYTSSATSSLSSSSVASASPDSMLSQINYGLQSANSVGSTNVSTFVDQKGQANVSIPIAMPEGNNGMHPMLSLSFNSAAISFRNIEKKDIPSSGWMGFGWGVSGISTINRCTMGKPNETRGNVPGDASKGTSEMRPYVQYNDTDSLCLDGEQLILVNGNYLRVGSQYRTRLDSFRLITMKGTDSEPWFEVRNPNGSVSVFGGKSNNRVKKRTDFQILYENSPYFLWAIESETDTFGNQITYNYNTKDQSFSYKADKQRIYPSSITYPQGRVNFVYASKDTTTPLDLSTLIDEGSITGLDHYRYDLDAAVQLKAVVVRRTADSDYRVYKIIGDNQTAQEIRGSGVRPKYIQECSVSAGSLAASCFSPVSFGWSYDNLQGYQLLNVTDSNGAKTEYQYSFTYGNTIAHPFKIPTQNWSSESSGITVVGIMKKSNGLLADGDNEEGKIKVVYNYLGGGKRDVFGKGFLGFAAIATHDWSANTTVFRQYSLNYSGLTGAVNLVAEHKYFPIYSSSGSELIAKTEYKPSSITFDYANGGKTYVNTTEQITSFNYEQGNLIGVNVKSNVYNVNQTNKTLSSIVSTTVDGLSISNPNFTPANWGDYPFYLVADADKRRTLIETTTMASATSDTDWRIGYKTKLESIFYAGAAGATGVDQKVKSIDYTVKTGTTLVESETLFKGDANLQLVTQYGYDSNGRRSSVSVSGANIEPRTTYFNYSSGNIEPDSVTNAYSYTLTNSNFDNRVGLAQTSVDPNGLVSTKEFDEFGRLVSVTNVDGVTSTTRFNVCNYCISASTKLGFIYPIYSEESSSAISPKATNYYDSLGRLVKKSVEGYSGELIYTDTEYDEQGRVYRTSLPYKSGATRYFTANTYDGRGRLITQAQADGGVTSNEYSAEYVNGEWWRKVKTSQTVKRADGSVLRTDIKTSYFNAAGYLVRTIDADGSTISVTTNYEYDALGNIVKTVVSGGADGSSTATAVFDNAGNKIQVTDSNSGTVSFKYTGLGEQRESTDAKGTVITSQYDKLGRLAKRISSVDGTQQWFYDPTDAIGQLSSVTNNSGYTQRYYYQDPGRRARLSQIQTEINVPDLGTKTFNEYVTYDEFGRLKKSTSPSGIAVSQQYNARGYVWRLFRDEWYPISEIIKSGAFGIEEQTVGSATKKATFDPKNGRILTQTSTQNGASIQNLSYKWLTNGSLQSKVDAKQSTSLTEAYTYDAMDRLTSASLTGGSTARTTSTAYNRLGNVQSNTSTNTADAQLTGYQYTSGRPHAVNSVVINGVSTTLAYNANGAITSYDAVGIDKDKFIAYNGYNQAVTIVSGAATDSTSANAREEFKYAPDGSRYYKKSSYLSNGQRYTDHTYYIGSYEITIFDAKFAVAQTEKSVFGDFLYIKRTPRTGAVTEIQEVLHRDYQGSVTAVTQGATVTQLAFESFGARRNPQTLASNLAKTDLDALLAKADVMTFRGYTDHESLDRTGLIHMNGRIFDPQLARFLSPDPFVQAPTNSQGWNRYSYVFNNPLKYTDPSGYLTARTCTQDGGCTETNVGCDEVCQRTSWYYSRAQAINSANARWENWGGAMYNVDSIYGQMYLSMAQGIASSLATIKPGGGSKKDTNNILGAINDAAQKGRNAEMMKALLPFVEEGDYIGFWETAKDYGDPLAQLALDFHDGLYGANMANGYAISSLELNWSRTFSNGERLNPKLLQALKAAVGRNLMVRHYDALKIDISRNIGTPGILSVKQIDQYHYDYFESIGLPKHTYGGFGVPGFFYCRSCDAVSE